MKCNIDYGIFCFFEQRNFPNKINFVIKNFVIKNFFLFLRTIFLSMAQRNDIYTMSLQTLQEGTHELTYKLNKEFIELHNIEDIIDVNVTVKVIFIKRKAVHSLEINLQGDVTMACDRCLEPVILPVENSQTFVVKTASVDDEFADSDDVILIHEDDKNIDLSHILYENLILSLPLKKTHEVNKCNKQIIAFLQKDKKAEKKEEINDPRWDSLKNIFKN